MNINKHVLRNAHLPLAIVIVIQLSVVYTIKLTVKSCHFTTKCKGLWSYDLMALYNMIINKVICLKRQISLWLGDIQKSYSKNKKVDVFWTQGILTPSSIGCQFSLSSLSRLFLFFSRPRSEGWPHHGRTFSIYLCPLSFWLTLPRTVLAVNTETRLLVPFSPFHVLLLSSSSSLL